MFPKYCLWRGWIRQQNPYRTISSLHTNHAANVLLQAPFEWPIDLEPIISFFFSHQQAKLYPFSCLKICFTSRSILNTCPAQTCVLMHRCVHTHIHTCTSLSRSFIAAEKIRSLKSLSTNILINVECIKVEGLVCS